MPRKKKSLAISSARRLLRVDDRGVTYIDGGAFEFAIFIPSKGRTDLIREQPLLEVANVLVHESEVAAYKKAVAESGATVVGHDCIGMGAIMNRILDLGFANEKCRATIRIDDDWGGLRWMFTRAQHWNETDPERLLHTIWAGLVMALDLGAGLFGFNWTPKPYGRTALQPFLLRNPVQGCFLAVCDRELRIHGDLHTDEDSDTNLMALHRTSLILTDQRWWNIDRGDGMGRMHGGMADVRTDAQQRIDLAKMERYWPGVFHVNWDEPRNNAGLISQTWTYDK